MLVDARSLPTHARVEADLCIVGGGTAGLVLAREFIGRGVRVCLLESGGLEMEPETQALAAGDNVGFPYFPLETARARCLGGSSTRWHVAMGGAQLGARLRPLDPLDFEKRAWVPNSGWPFPKRDLDPYYDQAQRVCQVEPATFEAQDWEDPVRRPRLPLEGDDVQTIIYKIGSRDPFVKQFPDELRRAENITVYLHANALEVETNDAGDQATRLRVGVLDHGEFTVVARAFVLAVGGIETPRLLLLSNRVRKAGLGNQHDLVGRFFMEHPHFWSGMLVPSKAGVFSRTALYNDVHVVNGVAIVGKLALTDQALRREGLLNQNIQFFVREVLNPFVYKQPDAEAVLACKSLVSGLLGRARVGDVPRHLAVTLGGLDKVAVAAGRKMRHLLLGVPKTPLYIFANMMEQVPNPESRVTLGSDRDRLGQRRVQLNWKMTTQDIESAIRTQQIIAGALERIGLGRFFQELRETVPPGNTEGGYHHMGTTRMHVDPRQGVVDAESRVHGVNNLYIAGPSVFPTGGYANPVLTVVALTLRLADRLRPILS